jgi:hypothetical protein
VVAGIRTQVCPATGAYPTTRATMLLVDTADYIHLNNARISAHSRVPHRDMCTVAAQTFLDQTPVTQSVNLGAYVPQSGEKTATYRLNTKLGRRKEVRLHNTILYRPRSQALRASAHYPKARSTFGMHELQKNNVLGEKEEETTPPSGLPMPKALTKIGKSMDRRHQCGGWESNSGLPCSRRTSYHKDHQRFLRHDRW